MSGAGPRRYPWYGRRRFVARGIASSAGDLVGPEHRRIGSKAVSKASSAPGKWLILRGYEQTEAGHAPAEAESLPGPPGAAPTAHLRSPTGDTGLPCDWLFTVATESVLIVDAASSYVIQANPAAAELLRAPQAALIGARVSECFEAASQPLINDSIDLARTSGRAETVRVRACGGEVDLNAKISFFHAGAEAYLLVRLSKDCERSLDGPPSPVFDAIEGAGVGFVITDSGQADHSSERSDDGN